ncbi:MAG: hypothetical protein AAFX99_02845 [Myxococcota bacterium]
MSTAPQTDDPPTWSELQRRLAFTLLRPAMRLCRLFRLPLSTVEELCRMAYFEEVRFGGHHSQAETALLMDRSLRTIGNLERQYRSDFLAPESELSFEREVEEMFSSGPLTVDHLAEELPHLDRVDLERLVGSLVNMGRLLEEGDPDGDETRYALNRDFVSLMRDALDAQLDGLGHQLGVIAQAVLSRFVAPERAAMARTLSFVALPEDMEALGDDMVFYLRGKCIKAEEKALKVRAFKRFAVTFAMAPMDQDDHHSRDL